MGLKSMKSAKKACLDFLTMDCWISTAEDLDLGNVFKIHKVEQEWEDFCY